MYTIARGESRTVIAIPSLGIALKVAWGRSIVRRERQAKLRRAWSYFWSDLSLPFRHPLRVLEAPYGAWWHWVGHGWEVAWHTTKYNTFQSVVANLRERRFYKRAVFQELMLITPTYFSLFGLVNVQKYGKPSTNAANYLVVSYAFARLTEGATDGDTHHFQHPENFTGLEYGMFKVLDYAEPAVQRIISENALMMLKGIDLKKARWSYKHYIKGVERNIREMRAEQATR